MRLRRLFAYFEGLIAPPAGPAQDRAPPGKLVASCGISIALLIAAMFTAALDLAIPVSIGRRLRTGVEPAVRGFVAA